MITSSSKPRGAARVQLGPGAGPDGEQPDALRRGRRSALLVAVFAFRRVARCRAGGPTVAAGPHRTSAGGHAQKSTGGIAGTGRVVGHARPDAQLLLDALLDLGGDVGFSRRKLRAFSLPWPSWSPSYVYQAPALRMIDCSTPTSISEPSREMPCRT
jgi:hypothetical protein